MSGFSTPRDASPSPPTDDAPAAHPTFAGKSLESLQRPRYKSYRKKYRKLHAKFNATFELNKQLYKKEAKLESVLRRLEEERDGLLDILLDLNSNGAISPELRYDLSFEDARLGGKKKLPLSLNSNEVRADITPAEADDRFDEYVKAVQDGRLPSLDLHIMHSQTEERLAAQDTRPLSVLEKSIPHPRLPGHLSPHDPLGIELRASTPISYFTTDAEMAYLRRLDHKAGDLPLHSTSKPSGLTSPQHTSDLNRRVELDNPQSQHNWLLKHIKIQAGGDILEDDAASLVSHEPSTKRKRGERKSGPGKGNLQRAALERARETHNGAPLSPSAASFVDDDDRSVADELPSASSRKKGGDPDKTYRVKGGKSGAATGAGTGKGKRKRNTGGDGDGAAVSSKKARMSEITGEE